MATSLKTAKELVARAAMIETNLAQYNSILAHKNLAERFTPQVYKDKSDLLDKVLVVGLAALVSASQKELADIEAELNGGQPVQTYQGVKQDDGLTEGMYTIIDAHAHQRRKGRTVELDLERYNDSEQLRHAAAAYLLAAVSGGRIPPDCWPWADRYWHPGTIVDNCAKAGALAAAAINMELAMYPDTHGVPPALAEELALEQELGGPRPEPLPLNASPDAEQGTPYRDIPIRQVVGQLPMQGGVDNLAPANPGPIPDEFQAGRFVCLQSSRIPYVVVGANWHSIQQEGGYITGVLCDIDGVGHDGKLGSISTTILRPWLSTVEPGSPVRVMEPNAKTPSEGYLVRCVNPNGTYDLNSGTAIRTGVQGSWLVPNECVPSTDV